MNEDRKNTLLIQARDLIAKLKKENESLKRSDEPIAIIGLSCEFPGARTVSDFWQMLVDGREGVGDIPKNRWDIDAYYNADPSVPGKMNTRRGGFISDIDTFDCTFFGISPKEAKYLDPQQRLLLTHTWNALEDAGIAPGTLSGSDTGVFIGLTTHDYNDLIIRNGTLEAINAYIGTGNAFSTASGRISYFLGLEGPNMAIDTACSSSLVALNEACERLERGECRLALVGGANALLNPEIFINCCKAGMLSPDGKCKTFDKNADGYVRGEGCGVVVLKRLSHALADNDRILAVIKASGINQDGASSGLTVPNGQSQEHLLSRVLSESGVESNEIDYLECHGTGTSLGDPIEVHALGQVYGKNRTSPLYLGSVKTNIGHLEAAAGVAGLIKIVLSLHAENIPANLNFHHLNPQIQMDFPGQIMTETHSWPRDDKPRRAALSSFGFSGTNAHVILEEAPEPKARDEELVLPERWLFVLSAKSRSSLEKLVAAYRSFLATTDDLLADICYTATVGRDHFKYRLTIRASDKEELLAGLGDKALVFHEVPISDERVDTGDLESAYLQGKQIDWARYYMPYVKALRKVALPTYQFDKLRYWLEIKPTQAEFSEELYPAFYQAVWTPANLDLPINNSMSATSEYVLISSSKNLPAIESKLNHLTKIVATINEPQTFDAPKTAELFHDTNLFIYYCDADVEQLMDELLNVQHITKQLIALNYDKPLLFISNRNSLIGQCILGAIKSLRKEYPYWALHYVEGDLLQDDSLWQQIFLLTAFKELTLRVDKQLLSEQLIPCSETMISTTKSTNKIKNKVYFITGGNGELGQYLIEQLLQLGVKYIVAVGRHAKPLPWSSAIEQLLSAKNTLLYRQCDIVQLADLEHVLTDLATSIPPITSIIHAAGTLNDKSWITTTKDELQQIVAGKALGALNLHKATNSLNLTDFILISSLAAVIGNKGQVAYASANAFLNALSAIRLAQGKPSLCFNLGPVKNTGFFKHNEQQISRELRTQGVAPLEKKSLFNLVLLTTNLSHLIYACLDPERIKALNSTSSNTAIHAATNLPITTVETPNETILDINANSLLEIAQNILQANQNELSSIEDDWFKVGMDSIMAAQITHKINKTYPLAKVQLPDLFSYPSAVKLAEILTERCSVNPAPEATKSSLSRNIPLSMQQQELKKSMTQIATEPELPVANHNPYQTNHLWQLSVQQIRIWRHIQEKPDNPAYRITSFMEIFGSLDVDALEKSIHIVIKRHAMLRCSFHTYLDTTFQFCHDKVPFTLQFLDLSDVAVSQQKLRINQVLEEVSQHQFDVTKASLLESRLIKCTDQQYTWTLSLSHLLSDGISSLIILQDILHYYALNLKGTTEAPSEEAVPYQAFIDWQLASFVNGRGQKYISYWQDKLHNYKPPQLPTDKAIPKRALTVGSRERVEILPEDLKKLRKLAQENQLTLANLLLAAYGLLLTRFSQTDHAFITMLCSGRELEQFRTTVGNVSNELPLIINFAPHATFISMIKQLQDDLVNSLDYQYFQPEQIAELGLPVPDVSFDFQHLSLSRIDTGFTIQPLSLEQVDLPLWGSNPRKLSLKFNCTNELSGYIKYRRDLYEEETIKLLCKQYVMILRQLIGNPEIKCGDLIMTFPRDKVCVN